jgi:hypothetical protein
MAARCDDPNCSCRSPELQLFTNQVLRRDAAKTDYLVIPLIGGVLANCFLAEAEIEGPDADSSGGVLDLAGSIRELAEAARAGTAWEDETHAYGIIANLVFCDWPGLLRWGSMSWFRSSLDIGWTTRPAEDLAATVRALGATPAPSWTDSVILATFAATTAGPHTPTNDYHLLGKIGRPLRVVLADRLRREHLTTWPSVLAAAMDDWTVPTLQQIARSRAMSGDASIHWMREAEEAIKAQASEEDAPAAAPPDPAPAAAAGETRDAVTAEELIEGAVAEIVHWRKQRDRVQQERDKLADRDTRHRSRIESLDRELKSSRLAQATAEGELATLRDERDQLLGRIAAYEAVAEGAPATAFPSDTFAGRRVLIFTGAENADTRNGFAQSFRDLGAAEADCYWADRSRGPDQFPADAIVAIDVTFMSHPTWTAIQERARASGAWCYWGRHGVATLSRATAAAWNARRV